MDDKFTPQHKLLAMGKPIKMARGGLLKTGIKDSPLENAKRNNGIVGLKKGGKVK